MKGNGKGMPSAYRGGGSFVPGPPHPQPAHGGNWWADLLGTPQLQHAPAGASVGGAGGFSFGSIFGGASASPTFNFFGASAEEPLTVESLLRLPGNECCADCGAYRPEWASVNQGTVFCIDCAGVHRSLGAHISKVKSLTLDAWKPEEIHNFRAKGGNSSVNSRLSSRTGGSGPNFRNGYAFPSRPDSSPAGKPDIEAYIRRKYQAPGPPGRSTNGNSDPRAGGHRSMPQAPEPSQVATVNPDGNAGRSCFQGMCFVDIMGVEISDDRARDLRMLGSMFLSLTVSMSLGTKTAESSSARRGSRVAAWDPAERRELLWDCEERWLWCRVYDGAELMGMGSLAAEGRIDLTLFGGSVSNAEVCLDLFATGGDDSDDDEAPESRRPASGFGPPGYWAEASARRQRGDPHSMDPTDPAVNGQCCGIARLRLTLIDMSGMDSGNKNGKTSQSQYQGREKNGDGSTWAFGIGEGLQSFLGLDSQSRQH